MADDSCPVDLRSRVGKYTMTKFVDETRGIYVYENRLSNTHHLFLCVGTRWTWCLKAQTNPELIGLVHILKMMGVEYNDSPEETERVEVQSEL